MPTQVSSIPTTLSIDLKKYRIRIHKSTLRLLGDPQYIQLLVNPESMAVAIRSATSAFNNDQTHKISQKQVQSDNSVELYSRPFITRLCTVADGLDNGLTYHMHGEVLPSQNLAVFSLKTLQRIDSL